MTERELRSLVTWTVDDQPPRARVGSALRTVLSTLDAVASFGATAGAAAGPTWTLPSDPDAPVGTGVVRVRGEAPWLLAGRSGRQRLQATQRSVLVVDARGRRAPRPVPLGQLRVATARPRTGRQPARHAAAPWTLELVGAGTVEVSGAWLALAWIGRLAGWPEPAGR